MKKTICGLLAVLLFVSVSGCGVSQGARQVQGNQGKSVEDVLNMIINESTQTSEDPSGQSSKKSTTDKRLIDAEPVDIDLTKLSSTMVYSEVLNMMTAPENYLAFAYAEGDSRYYFACIISDATACCAQGIEFVLKDERKFPDEYPSEGAEITVVGIFDTYIEGEYQYLQLIDATME